MPIRAVLFDLGDTLVSYYQPLDFIPVLCRSLEACSRALGRTPPMGDAQTDLVLRALELRQERADLAVWPLEERLRVLFRQDTEFAGERLSRAFLGPIVATARVNADALPVLNGLKRRGIRTAIVSNTPWGSSGRVWRTELARYEFFGSVDVTVFCRDVGWRKPHPAPFRRALEMLGVAATDAAFVGDDPMWDVQGAVSAGVLPMLLSKPSQQRMPAHVVLAASLPEVLAKVDQLNSAASAGPQPMLA